jgi:hypothetical protein
VSIKNRKEYFVYLPARHAGISIPDDLAEFDSTRYPHWSLLVECLQHCLGSGSLPPLAERVKRARALADIPAWQLLSGEITCARLLGDGLGCA